MGLLRLRAEDVSGFKLLFCLAFMYAVMSVLVNSVIHMKFVKPLDVNAPLDRFSEGRALDHLRVLSQDIGGRQVGRESLDEAARYIKAQLEMIKQRAGPKYRIEIDENIVNGSFNMMFLGHSISLGYRNTTNIVMRMSSLDSQDSDPSVMLNGHYDSSLGSPGAGDCGSCVASMLELARLAVDSGWVPPRPIIYLFNGAEELFMVGAHGFMKTQKWRDSIGAAINIEAAGTGGIDLVCQSGPGSWPSTVYAESALYPMANSAAQDVFPVIPGDTDYRIFSEDHGDIPGLDIIFLIGGYYYHTSYDTIERIIPGSIQARGDNLFSLVKAFASSPNLRNAHERKSLRVNSSGHTDERAVFFDYFTWFMVYYSRKTAMLLHCIPTAIVVLVPFFLHRQNIGLSPLFAAFCDLVKGMFFHFTGIVLAVILPVAFSVLRLLFSSQGMNWFANPYLAYAMFVPSSLIGLLLPTIIWNSFPLSQEYLRLKIPKEALSDQARFWGAFGIYGSITLAYLLAGLSGGFLTFILAFLMLPAWVFYCLSTNVFGRESLRPVGLYVAPLIPCILYTVYYGAFLVQFLLEKMSMMGHIAPPYGRFIPDAIMAATVGIVTGWCTGPLLPICGRWLARSSILQFLLHLSVLALALSSQFFPYSESAPKRVILQHTLITEDANRLVESSYDISVADSNSLSFLFKHVPEAAEKFRIGSEFPHETSNESHRRTWMALYPVSFLSSRSMKIPASSDEILMQYKYFPNLYTYKPHEIYGDGSRKVYLELSLGSCKEVWVAVLNITGPLSGWSFSDNILPAAETVGGGPPSYILRLSGTSQDNWTFWLEANKSEDLRIDVAVLDQYIVDPTIKLKRLFPKWVDVLVYSSFLSSYIF